MYLYSIEPSIIAIINKFEHFVQPTGNTKWQTQVWFWFSDRYIERFPFFIFFQNIYKFPANVYDNVLTIFRCVWDLEAGKREMEFDAHAGDVVTISLAPGMLHSQVFVGFKGSLHLETESFLFVLIIFNRITDWRVQPGAASPNPVCRWIFFIILFANIRLRLFFICNLTFLDFSGFLTVVRIEIKRRDSLIH